MSGGKLACIQKIHCRRQQLGCPPTPFIPCTGQIVKFASLIFDQESQTLKTLLCPKTKDARMRNTFCHSGPLDLVHHSRNLRHEVVVFLLQYCVCMQCVKQRLYASDRVFVHVMKKTVRSSHLLHRGQLVYASMFSGGSTLLLATAEGVVMKSKNSNSAALVRGGTLSITTGCNAE